MTEIFLACRDGVGLHSTVILDDNPVLIKDLPPKAYDLYHRGERVSEDRGPNSIPGFLLHYCTRLESEDFEFKGKSIYDMITNLGVVVIPR